MAWSIQSSSSSCIVFPDFSSGCDGNQFGNLPWSLPSVDENWPPKANSGLGGFTSWLTNGSETWHSNGDDSKNESRYRWRGWLWGFIEPSWIFWRLQTTGVCCLERDAVRWRSIRPWANTLMRSTPLIPVIVYAIEGLYAHACRWSSDDASVKGWRLLWALGQQHQCRPWGCFWAFRSRCSSLYGFWLINPGPYFCEQRYLIIRRYLRRKEKRKRSGGLFL